MDEMVKKPSWLHLEPMEIAVFGAFAFLLSGLCFTLGVMVGHGLSPQGAKDSQHAAESAHTPGTGHAAADADADEEHGHRAPASEPKTKAPGEELKAAFQSAKQQALTDWALKGAGREEPQSVLDVGAHMETHEEWDRKPAAINQNTTGKVEELRKQELKRTAEGPPPTVGTLFERDKNAGDDFSPVASSFTVQIASYATSDEARARVAGLRASGINDAYFSSQKLSNGEKWYRVGVGSFPSADWARKTGEQLLRRKLAKEYVVRQAR